MVLITKVSFLCFSSYLLLLSHYLKTHLALFGWLANVIPRAYTFYISTALFAIFGLKMLKEGFAMSPTGGQEELEEVQTDLRKKEEEVVKFIVNNHMLNTHF